MVRGGLERALGHAEPLRASLELVVGDVREPDTLREAIARLRPDELYHLAAPSFVPASWDHPEAALRAIAGPAATVLEAAREAEQPMRVFVPASGAIFGDTSQSPQREDTPCRPTSPYAIAKLAAHQLVGVMRERYGLHASSGITYNHESERRPAQFVSRRISRGAAAIALGREQELRLGALEAVRDWSFAGDIVRGAWMMLQQARADDYVLASGVAHTVADLVRVAFACVDLDSERYVRVDPELVRPAETTPSVGDPSKARGRLGWRPEVSFEQLVERMVRADMSALAGAGASR